MEHELQAESEAGQRLVALAETLADEFAARAADHDREGSFPVENIEALRASGYLAAPVPRSCGGMGVDTVRDVLIASSRLARGDGSTTIGVNMHLNVTMGLRRSYERALANRDGARAAGIAETLDGVAHGEVILASLSTEPGRELTEPATRATRTPEGWAISGKKTFATMSEAATHLVLSVSWEDASGDERVSFVQVPSGQPGVTLHHDWDAMGMRASGSGSVSFEDIPVADGRLVGGFPIGTWSAGLMERFLSAGLVHASPYLGIAEAAARQGLAMASKARKGRAGRPMSERPMIQLLAAENAVELAGMRGIFDRAARLVDAYFAAHVACADHDAVLLAFKEAQCAKTFLNGAAVRVVDRSLTLSGGAGYMAHHPLSRLYRDVRAGAFMHPLAANTAHEFIGRVELGLTPDAA
jgi:alkylation response protein AidB-like acyl-CoA dehydrogenase